MRTKEVDDAINQLIVDINFSETGCSTGIIDIKNIEALLSYISELEKENKMWQEYKERLDKLDSKDFIFKQEIRDKIKVLEGCIEEFKPQGYIEGELKAKIEVLKELLEGE